jgi:hypothetical protein
MHTIAQMNIQEEKLLPVVHDYEANIFVRRSLYVNSSLVGHSALKKAQSLCSCTEESAVCTNIHALRISSDASQQAEL